MLFITLLSLILWNQDKATNIKITKSLRAKSKIEQDRIYTSTRGKVYEGGKRGYANDLKLIKDKNIPAMRKVMKIMAKPTKKTLRKYTTII